MENGTMIINLNDVDLTGMPEFEEYANFKDALNFELAHRPFAYTYLPPAVKMRDEALTQSMNLLPEDKLKEKADTLIKAQKLDSKHNDLFEHMASKRIGDYNRFSSLWSPILWQAREDSSKTQVSVNGRPVETFDLDYLIAESLQHLYSSEDPRAEYHDWIEHQKKIEVDLITDGATEDEVAARNAFIGFLDDREIELKRVMFLYAGAAFNSNSRQQAAAQEKLKFLVFKLSELRRLRERTQNTKSHADSKEYFEKQEHRRQQEAAAVTAGLVTAEMVSLGNRRLQQKANIQALERGIGESFVRLKPETQTREEAEEKIDTTLQNARNTRAMSEAIRNGMSKEEWLKAQETKSAETVRNKIRSLRGFTVRDYQEYANSY